MWRTRLNFHDEARKLVGTALLHQSTDSRRSGLLNLSEVEAAGHAPEPEFAFHVLSRRRVLEPPLKFFDLRPFAAVEGLEPRGEFLASGSLGYGRNCPLGFVPYRKSPGDGD